jgi:hypothetical protein
MANPAPHPIRRNLWVLALDAGSWDWRVVAITLPLVLLSRIFSVALISGAINFGRSKHNGAKGLGWRSQLVLWWAGCARGLRTLPCLVS